MRIDVATLLRLQRSAYRLLLHIDRLGRDDPSWLSPDVVQTLSDGASAMAWIQANRPALPERLLAEADCEVMFGNLVASFFCTSFHADYLASGDKIDFARLRLGAACERPSPIGERTAVAYAIRHLLAYDGVRIDSRTARRLAKSRGIHNETRVIAYVWELDRRARGKSKGPVAHEIWKAIPRELRAELAEEIVWLAFDVVRRKATSTEREEHMR